MVIGRQTVDPTTSSLDVLRDEVVNEFRKRYSREPQYVAAAPGRVNLIGEHTDYNGGFVLPMAIERYVVIAAAKSNDHRNEHGEPVARFIARTKMNRALVQVSGKIEPGPVSWSSYVQGVIAGFVQRSLAVPPFEAVIQSNVPLGGGLSSSAALEVAVAHTVGSHSGTTARAGRERRCFARRLNTILQACHAGLWISLAVRCARAII